MNAKALFALSLVAAAAAVSAAQPAKVAQDLNLKFDEKYHPGPAHRLGGEQGRQRRRREAR